MVCCSDSGEDPLIFDGPSLEKVKNIVVQDNGNVNDASDIEVNFDEQIDQSNIAEYRVMAIKAESANAFSVDDAVQLSTDRYGSVTPANIFPLKGLSYSSSSLDVDGEVIHSDQEYRFAVLSVPIDGELNSPSLLIDPEAFQLTINNQVVNHTGEFEGGAGSISIDDNDNLYMGSYNIVTHLVGDETPAYPVYRIRTDGGVTEYTSPFGLLAGNAFDAQSNLYQAVRFDESIAKISPDGQTEIIKAEGALLSDTEGIFVGGDGSLFVVNARVGFVGKVNADGSGEVFADVGNNPRGITGDESGNLYVSHNNESGEIMKITPDGEVTTIANIPTYRPPDYTLDYLMWVGYLTYHAGNLYVAGMSTDRVYKVGLDGGVEVFAGSGRRGVPRGGTLTANLNRPIGLAFSQDGSSLYISVCTDTTPQHTQATTPVRVLEIQIVE